MIRHRSTRGLMSRMGQMMCVFFNYFYRVMARWLDVVAFGEAEFVFEAAGSAFECGADFDA